MNGFDPSVDGGDDCEAGPSSTGREDCCCLGAGEGKGMAVAHSLSVGFSMLSSLTTLRVVGEQETNEAKRRRGQRIAETGSGGR